MRTEIRELHQKLRTTIVYVTHDQIEAMTMADKIVVLRDGRVEQVGTPLELYDYPANLFVAGFLGSPSMNLIPGTLETPQRFRTDSGIAIDLPEPIHAPPEPKLILGVRPEDLTLVERGIPCEVAVVEPTGAELQVIAKLGGEEITATTRAPAGVGSPIAPSAPRWPRCSRDRRYRPGGISSAVAASTISHSPGAPR